MTDRDVVNLIGIAVFVSGCAADQYYKEKGKVQNGAKVSG